MRTLQYEEVCQEMSAYGTENTKPRIYREPTKPFEA